MSDVRATILALIGEHLDVPLERVTPEASLVRDLAADSLSLIELALALETEFEIDIEAEDVSKIRTVLDAIEYVELRVATEE